MSLLHPYFKYPQLTKAAFVNDYQLNVHKTQKKYLNQDVKYFIYAIKLATYKSNYYLYL